MSAEDFKTLKEGLTFVRDQHDRHGDDEGGELEQDPDCFCARCVAVRGLAALARLEAEADRMVRHEQSLLMNAEQDGAQIADLQANAAAMREALERCEWDRDGEHCGECGRKRAAYYPDDRPHAPDCRKAAALATDAGAGLLARLREHEGCTERARLATQLNKALMERAEKAEAHVERLKQSHALVVGEADFAQKRAEKAEAERDAAKQEALREGNLHRSTRNDLLRATAKLRKAEAERDALHAFEANVRELLAKASTPGKGPTHHCAHCLASFDGPEATNEHARACPQSPVARENAALRAEVEQMREEAKVEAEQRKVLVRSSVLTAMAEAQTRREERDRCASAAWLWWRDRDPDCDDGDSLRDAIRALGDAPA